LKQRRNYQLNEAAERVAGLWHEPTDAAELEKRLRESTGGKNLLGLGLETDIAFSAQIDTIGIVPQLIPKTIGFRG
jgi:phosphosulfolactate phosphohydrolase-like enzyme